MLETCLPNFFLSLLYPGRPSVVGPGHGASSLRGELAFMTAQQEHGRTMGNQPTSRWLCKKGKLLLCLSPWYLGHSYFCWTYIQMEILNTEILSQLLRVHISTTYSDLVEMRSPHGGVLTDGFPRFPLAGNWILLCWLPMVINLYFPYWIEYFIMNEILSPFLTFLPNYNIPQGRVSSLFWPIVSCRISFIE